MTIIPSWIPQDPLPEGLRDRDDVAAALALEARRQGCDTSAVKIVAYADVMWSDGSLGCPEPGMMYTTALVPGRLLLLAASREVASYHAAAGQPFFYCPTPRAPLPGEARS